MYYVCILYVSACMIVSVCIIQCTYLSRMKILWAILTHTDQYTQETWCRLIHEDKHRYMWSVFLPRTQTPDCTMKCVGHSCGDDILQMLSQSRNLAFQSTRLHMHLSCNSSMNNPVHVTTCIYNQTTQYIHSFGIDSREAYFLVWIFAVWSWFWAM